MLNLQKFRLWAVLVLCGLTLAACANGSRDVNGVYDPHETRNRKVHQANVALDQGFVGPASRGYGKGVPEPVRQGVDNFAGNLSVPGDVVNNVLQLRLGKAAHNTARFAINSTIGILGVFDPAKLIGLDGRPSDFGETLYVWGVPEGAYVELPILGPSTERHAVGRVVDYALNPMRYLIDTPESNYARAAGVLELANDRSQYDALIQETIYNSADSYAQARQLYLQNRRFTLGDTQDEDYFDPYEDPYAE
jgi:phospholipid-binding lipoprotein MlaA